jgi:hypothetical protein
MAKFDKDLLAKARASVKQAFVPMPGGQGEPVAGASQMTAALPGAPQGDPAAGGMPPGDPAAMGIPPGMDPAAAGMPPGGDPAAMGGAPIDPAAGGMPPGMDPAMMEQLMGAAGGGAPADGNITMPVSQLLQLIQTLLGQAISGAPESGKPTEGGEPKKKGGGTSSKIDAIYQALASQGVVPPEGAQPQV